MRKTNLKEMYIVRYADDFRIFCQTKTTAEKTKIVITQWLSERSRYGKSARLRYLADKSIYPIGYVRNKIPMNMSSKAQAKTVELPRSSIADCSSVSMILSSTDF
ncbi:MAG: hypothetical protein SR1Q5_08050 [Quinella sp. 1Q5]|nr:hypothetical protein [Quinella sp. 1Q5]